MRLETVAGPYGDVFEIDGVAPCTIGRIAASTICLLDGTVSRRHASVMCRGGAWFLIDHGSTSGTFVNGVRLTPEEPMLLGDGDLVQLGPWTFRTGIGERSGSRVRTIDDSTASHTRVESVRSGPAPTDRRLDLLMSCIGSFNEATDEEELARIALRAALDGSGYVRGAMLRSTGEQADVDVVVSVDSGDQPGSLSFSRTLVARARAGETVVLSREGLGEMGQSVAELNIHSALCVPVRLGDSVPAFLYLDARGSEGRVRSLATGFCETVARAYGMSLAELKRRELEHRQRAIQAELQAAHEAQKMILPTGEGSVGSVQYALRVTPGVFVAGDMFDVIDLGDAGVAVLLGDVSGHGVGSALMMALTQSQIHAQVRLLRDPARAMEAANAYVAAHLPMGRFVSAWLGVFGRDGTVQFVDAGHGHWLIVAGEEVRSPRHRGGIPIGVDPGASYENESVTLRPGERVILYTDGLTEQTDPRGEAFGAERLKAQVREGALPGDDVRRVFDAVRAFSAGKVFADDATIGSILFTG